MITFYSARKLSTYLIRAKLYPLERILGSSNFYSRWYKVCDNVTETLTFNSTVTQNTFKINHQFNCSKKRLVYLLTRNKYLKQYVWQTIGEFHWRYNNYKFNDRILERLKPCMQKIFLVISQWQATKGYLNDVSIAFIDKTDPFDPLRREDFWRQTLKTMASYGNNIEDIVWYVLLLLLFYMVFNISNFYTVMSAYFKDHDFGITEIVSSVNIVSSFVVCLLSLLLLIIIIIITAIVYISIIIVISVIIIIIIPALFDYLFGLPFFNTVVFVSILSVNVVLVEPCRTCTLNDSVPCSIKIEPYRTFKSRFVQRNIVNW